MEQDRARVRHGGKARPELLAPALLGPAPSEEGAKADAGGPATAI